MTQSTSPHIKIQATAKRRDRNRKGDHHGHQNHAPEGRRRQRTIKEKEGGAEEVGTQLFRRRWHRDAHAPQTTAPPWPGNAPHPQSRRSTSPGENEQELIETESARVRRDFAAALEAVNNPQSRNQSDEKSRETNTPLPYFNDSVYQFMQTHDEQGRPIDEDGNVIPDPSDDDEYGC
ncbi:hypothetical protein [Bifidobacterium sp. ESL0745]|uniref:hypothetical protein n=1 Tax=Bifidobacterium sp. ESL0745 TaxID=2983226 RepID=UPI0023F732F5|nr:hypothetical protein [Bifidobacterium sp. ESL0745]MDF7666125.1 hypothetical protein [Bifidobacterium sp. ESL0745]